MKASYKIYKELGTQMEKVLISIVTYNSKEIFKTLDNLKREVIPFFSVQVRIFDNNSKASYVKKINSYASDEISITNSDSNLGFGWGHNENFKKRTDEKIFIVCNPDILINRESFATLVTNFSSFNETVEMLTPKVLFPDGTTQHLVRRRLDVFDYALRFQPFQFLKRIFSNRMANFACEDMTDTRQTINFGSGCFMVIKSEAFAKLDGFDTKFFMYFEDNDFCVRLRQGGGRIMYVPDAPVIHFYAKEAHHSFKVFRIFIKSMIYYFNKWGWEFF